MNTKEERTTPPKKDDTGGDQDRWLKRMLLLEDRIRFCEEVLSGKHDELVARKNRKD